MSKNSMTTKDRPLTVMCNPYANIGRTVAALNLIRAFRKVYVHPFICDISSSKYFPKHPDIINEFGSDMVDRPQEGINIFVANVDEIPTLRSTFGKLPLNSYNILYPAWELGKCPEYWRAEISDFDEIWVPSSFVGEAFRGVFDKEITLIPHPVEIEFSCMLNRSHFMIPDSAYTFYFPFDFRSYSSRKNPSALLRVFEQVFSNHLYEDIFLLIKVIGETTSASALDDFAKLETLIGARVFRNRVRMIKGFLSENEKNNLLRLTDCLVSLHRSEGFGLSLAESMLLGKPVIATGYSGNLDFMNPSNSYLVDYKLLPLQENDYPESNNQVWAEPNEKQAVEYINQLLEAPQLGNKIGSRASLDVRLELSYLSIGNLMIERLGKIESQFQKDV